MPLPDLPPLGRPPAIPADQPLPPLRSPNVTLQPLPDQASPAMSQLALAMAGLGAAFSRNPDAVGQVAGVLEGQRQQRTAVAAANTATINTAALQKWQAEATRDVERWRQHAQRADMVYGAEHARYMARLGGHIQGALEKLTGDKAKDRLSNGTPVYQTINTWGISLSQVGAKLARLLAEGEKLPEGGLPAPDPFNPQGRALALVTDAEQYVELVSEVGMTIQGVQGRVPESEYQDLLAMYTDLSLLAKSLSKAAPLGAPPAIPSTTEVVDRLTQGMPRGTDKEKAAARVRERRLAGEFDAEVKPRLKSLDIVGAKVRTAYQAMLDYLEDPELVESEATPWMQRQGIFPPSRPWEALRAGRPWLLRHGDVSVVIEAGTPPARAAEIMRQKLDQLAAERKKLVADWQIEAAE